MAQIDLACKGQDQAISTHRTPMTCIRAGLDELSQTTGQTRGTDMIEEPPLLQILSAEKRPRPTPEMLAIFEGAETGHVCDCMGGIAAIDAAIKPVGNVPTKLLGPALTVECGPADILALVAALDEAKPGDVIVMSTGNYRHVASLGDQVTGMGRNAQVAGFVTDGMVRDIAGIEAVGLPVFAAGITPNSPFGKGPGKVGYPVTVGGRTVASGDLVIGDRDGIATVPYTRLDDAAAALARVREDEAILAQKVAEGATLLDGIRDILDGPQTSRE